MCRVHPGPVGLSQAAITLHVHIEEPPPARRRVARNPVADRRLGGRPGDRSPHRRRSRRPPPRRVHWWRSSGARSPAGGGCDRSMSSAWSLPVSPPSTNSFAIAIDHRDRSVSPTPVWVEIGGVRIRLERTAPTTLSDCAPPSGRRAVAPGHDHVGRCAQPRVVAAPSRRRHRPDSRRAATGRSAGARRAHRLTDARRIDGGNGAKTGHVDGSRPWRPGESEQAIHWPSTLRAGEVIAHDRTTEAEARWQLDLDNDAGTTPPHDRGGTPARAPRHAHTARPRRCRGHECRRRPTLVGRRRRAVDLLDGPLRSFELRSGVDHCRWARGLERTAAVGTRSRLATAAAAAISLWMLLGGLAAGPVAPRRRPRRRRPGHADVAAIHRRRAAAVGPDPDRAAPRLRCARMDRRSERQASAGCSRRSAGRCPTC